MFQKILENGKSEIIKLFKEDLVNETIKAGGIYFNRM